MKQSICSLPIYFSVKNEISNKDERFLEVEIDVLHEGLNLNQSIFSKEVVNQNVNTIKNTPILGFIRELPDGENDFKGHEYIITKTDKNGLTRKYIGSAFGLIPESCNARWITKMSEDGQERDYLRVDGILWTKFSDSIDIMMRDIEKPHSMELFPDNIEGYEDEDGNFVFTSFNFDGCCILGSTDDIQPAMISSNIKIKDYEVQFTMKDFVKNLQSELNDKYSTFTKLNELVNENNKGGITTMPNTDFSTVLQMFKDISDTIAQHELIEDRWGDKYPRYYAVDIQENEVIVVDRMNNYNYFAFSFTMNGDSIEIDFENCKRKKISYEDYVEGVTTPEGAFDFGKHIADIEESAFTKVSEANTKVETAEQAKTEAETNYTAIKSDYDDIKPKYDAYVLADEQRQAAELEAQKDAKFSEYEETLGENADFVALKERKDELSVDDIEKECALLYVKVNRAKSNFSKTSGTSVVTGVFKDDDEDDGYVDTKYGRIRKSR